MAKGKKITYTQQGYQQLVDELQYLRVEKREKIKNDIALARSFGDLSENAEYDEARNEQAKNEARIKDLEELLENAVIMDENTIDTSVASLGSTVKVRFADGEIGDQKRVMTPAEAKKIGSDYIVVGRPITAAEDPVAAYERCVKEFIG